MSAPGEGPVAVSEIQDVVDSLRALSARAGEAGQGGLAMVCGLAAESLSDNLESAISWGCNDE